MMTGIIIVCAVVVAAGCLFGGWTYHNAQIDKMRNQGIDSLHNIVSLSDYRQEEQKDIEKIPCRWGETNR